MSPIAIYGIVENEDPGNGAYEGVSYIIIWKLTIHGVCITCLGPECSTNKCYYIDHTVDNIGIPNDSGIWYGQGIPSSVVTSKTDLITSFIGLTVSSITGYGKFIPISRDNISNKGRYDDTVANPPNIPHISFLKQHCE